MTYDVVTNRSGTLHVRGLSAATTGGGRDMGDHVSYWPMSACPGLTRLGPFVSVVASSDSLDSIARSLDALGKFRKRCANCDRALARAMGGLTSPCVATTLRM